MVTPIGTAPSLDIVNTFYKIILYQPNITYSCIYILGIKFRCMNKFSLFLIMSIAVVTIALMSGSIMVPALAQGNGTS